MHGSTLQSEAVESQPATIEQKEANLRALLRRLNHVLVAFSGGVDSSYLALIAAQELGERAFCVTGISASVSADERRNAAAVAEKFAFNYSTIETDELADPNYQANPTNRCYFCKTELYGKLGELAKVRGIAVVLDGQTTDDLSDHRPGQSAAHENNVRSLLVEVELSKSQIRELSRRHDLPTWDKPASPCLSSRIAYGVPVTIARLGKIERGETILRELGFKVFRVRNHGDLARIEIAPDEMERILQKTLTDELARQFRALGFRYVTLDLHGFRSGAMNESIKKDEG